MHTFRSKRCIGYEGRAGGRKVHALITLLTVATVACTGSPEEPAAGATASGVSPSPQAALRTPAATGSPANEAPAPEWAESPAAKPAVSGGGEPEGSPDRPVAQLWSPPPPRPEGDWPLIRIGVDGLVTQGYFASSCWEKPHAGPTTSVTCVTADGAPEDARGLEVKSGTVLLLFVDGDEDPESLGAYLRRRSDFSLVAEYDLGSTRQAPLELAADPGEYVLGVSGNWPQGDSNYQFPLSIR